MEHQVGFIEQPDLGLIKKLEGDSEDRKAGEAVFSDAPGLSFFFLNVGVRPSHPAVKLVDRFKLN